MVIACPHCQHRMKIKEAQPGKYKPKCAKCGERFLLRVYADRAPVTQLLETFTSMAQAARKSNESTIQQQPPTEAFDATKTLASEGLFESFPSSADDTAPPQHNTPSSTADTAALNAANAETLPSVNPSFDHTEVHASSAKEEDQADTKATGVWDNTGMAKATKAASPTDETVPHQKGSSRSRDLEEGSLLGAGMPEVLGGYRLIKKLGQGAMGAVYLARQVSLDRDVALKTIQAQWADDPTFIARFTREAYAAAQLTHHNIVQIYDLGQEEDTHFFSMEYVQGKTLDQLIEKQGKLDPKFAVSLILQAARGLLFAHLQGMVHRDVKPANLMLNDHGVVKVADLGLVKTVAQPEEPAPQPKAESDPRHQSGHYIEPTQQDSKTLHINIWVDGVKTTTTGILGPEQAALLGGPTQQPSLTGPTTLPARKQQTQRPDQTALNTAMGTPAYMAPEQSENAAGVDHRADIYSLGCTLYVLLTGHPPFSGKSALEVITKHRTEEIVRPDAVVKNIPQALSDIVIKMVAKLPEERFAHLGEVIAAFEHLLGIQAGRPFTPSEQQTNVMISCQETFNHTPAVHQRRWTIIGFFVVCLLSMLVLLPINAPLAGGMFGLLVMTPPMYFVVSGLRDRTFLFGKVRSLIFSSRWKDWLKIAAAGSLVLGLLILTGMFWHWLAAGGFALGFVFIFSLFVDRRVRQQREQPLEKAYALFRTLRLQGLDETALQQFVAKYSGQDWEEFYETIFGYEAMLSARSQLQRVASGKRRKFRPWRDPLIRWIDDQLQDQREARDRKILQKVEEESLQAQGMDLLAARKLAQRQVEVILDEAAESRATVLHEIPMVVDPAVLAEKKRARIKKMLAEAKAGQYQARRKKRLRTVAAPVAFLLSPTVRFWAGCVLLLGFGLWASQNDLFNGERFAKMTDAVRTSIQDRDTWKLEETIEEAAEGVYQPLGIPVDRPVVQQLQSRLCRAAAGHAGSDAGP